MNVWVIYSFLNVGGIQAMIWNPEYLININSTNFNSWPTSLVRDFIICSTFCNPGHECKQVPPQLSWNCRGISPSTPRREDAVIGSDCDKDDECDVVMGATCQRGKCLCEPGLSFDQANRCTRGCLHYGNDFSKYPDLSTTEHNTENVFNVNEGVCLASCLNTTKFLCISAELGLLFGLTHCHMSEEGYLDVPMEDRCPDSEDYFFFTRNCMPRYTIRCR